MRWRKATTFILTIACVALAATILGPPSLRAMQARAVVDVLSRLTTYDAKVYKVDFYGRSTPFREENLTPDGLQARFWDGNLILDARNQPVKTYEEPSGEERLFTSWSGLSPVGTQLKTSFQAVCGWSLSGSGFEALGTEDGLKVSQTVEPLRKTRIWINPKTSRPVRAQIFELGPHKWELTETIEFETKSTIFPIPDKPSKVVDMSRPAEFGDTDHAQIAYRLNGQTAYLHRVDCNSKGDIFLVSSAVDVKSYAGIYCQVEDEDMIPLQFLELQGDQPRRARAKQPFRYSSLARTSEKPVRWPLHVKLTFERQVNMLSQEYANAGELKLQITKPTCFLFPEYDANADGSETEYYEYLSNRAGNLAPFAMNPLIARYGLASDPRIPITPSRTELAIERLWDAVFYQRRLLDMSNEDNRYMRAQSLASHLRQISQLLHRLERPMEALNCENAANKVMLQQKEYVELEENKRQAHSQ